MLGVVQYYHQFLPDLATVLNPLHRLLQKNVNWYWSSECKQAFKEYKNHLTSKTLLVQYDPSKRLRLACDASSYGLGSVLFHEFENGDERPISYASRAMNKSERNYAQIEHEALSLIFGVKNSMIFCMAENLLW